MREYILRPNRRHKGFKMPPKLTDRAWAAGFFDGEGCVMGRDRKFDHTPNKCIHLELTVNNTHKKSIERLKELFNGNIQFIQSTNRCKDTWRWVASANVARIFLKSTLPYLITKKEQAEIGLKLLNLKNFQWSSERYSQEQELLNALRLLNKKGKREN